VYHRFSKEKKCEVTWLERAVISGIRILLLLPAKISRESILNGSLIATLIHEHTIWARSNYFSPIVAGRPHCGIKKLQEQIFPGFKKASGRDSPSFLWLLSSLAYKDLF
jgi:hypothetical protein